MASDYARRKLELLGEIIFLWQKSDWITWVKAWRGRLRIVFGDKLFQHLGELKRLVTCRSVTRGTQFPGRRINMWALNHCQERRMSAEGAKKSKIYHKYFLQYRTCATERPQVQTWGRQTRFLPQAPYNLVTHLVTSHIYTA